MATIVFQHSDANRPGRLGRTLRDHGHRLAILRPDQGEPIPPDYDDVEGVISLGGPQTLVQGEDRPEWLEREIDFVRGAHERQLPVIGVCLGCQIIAAALGGIVERMDQPEVGFFDLNILPAGQTDNVLAGIAWKHPAFQAHDDQVTAPPDGAVLLAGSQRCKVQAFKVGVRTYAFQHHFGADRPIIEDLLKANPESLHRSGFTEQEVREQTERDYDTFARLSDRLCVNLATLVAMVGRKHVI